MYDPLYLTLHRNEEHIKVYSCNGTPVDCVKMAYDWLLPKLCVEPSLNISGINHGSNAAINVLYSGTMGAAIEASFYGAPSIGLSLDDHSPDADFDATIEFAKKLIPAMLGVITTEPLCLNVNVPRCAASEMQGVRLCRQTRGFWREDFYARQDPQGRDYFWLTGAFQNAEPEAEDTDEWALAHKYVSVVPVQVDMTDYRMLKSLDGVIK
jgi:5'-nucleotidase